MAETERRNRFIIKLKIGPETFSSRKEESDENATEYKAGPEREEEASRRMLRDAVVGASLMLFLVVVLWACKKLVRKEGAVAVEPFVCPRCQYRELQFILPHASERPVRTAVPV